MLTTSDPLLTEREAAALLKVSARTLQAWRWRGGGPTFIRLGANGRAVRYRRSDIEAFISRGARVSTTAPAASAGRRT